VLALLATLLSATPAPAAAPRSVELLVASTRAALEGPLLVRLTQEGFFVYPKDRAAAVRIRIADLGTELRIEVEAGGVLRAETVTPGAETPAELQLEVTQKAVELAQAAAAQLEAAAAAPTPPPPPTEPPPAPPPLPAPEIEAPHAVAAELRIDFGLLSAPYVIAAPLFQLGLRIGRLGQQLAGHLITGGFPVTGFDQSNTTPGFLAQAGVGYRFLPVWRLEIEPVLLAGVVMYDSRRGGVVVTPGLLLGLKLGDIAHVGLRAVGGVTFVHFASTLVNPPVYIDTGIYLAFNFW
jgi:hypothetical protein